MKMHFVWMLVCLSLLACSSCGTNVSEASARSQCPDLSINEFNDTVELARLRRDSGDSKEDWNSALGLFCIEYAIDFSDCSQCVRAIGGLVWGG